MGDIEKIKIIHKLDKNFSLNEEQLNNLVSQIESSKFKNKIERFFRGYTIEDNFKYLFSALSWLKLVHSLDQNQLPLLSKEIYQVPDYMILYETSTETTKPLAIEVKSVKGDKQSLEVMSRQLDACARYSRDLNVTLLYAIFWGKYQFWTLNTIDNFEQKNSVHRINFFNAIKNDLSVILGDFTFIVNYPIYRKTICDKSITNPNLPKHNIYGSIIDDKLSYDLKTFIDIEPIESAVVDSYMKMNEFDIESVGNKTTLIEKSSGNYYYKISTLIPRHLAVIGAKLAETTAAASKYTIFNLMEKLRAQRGFVLPVDKTNTSNKLFSEAFKDTWILKLYKKSNISSGKISDARKSFLRGLKNQTAKLMKLCINYSGLQRKEGR